MNIDEILEMIDDTLDKGATVPFSGKKVMVDADKIRDLLNEIRVNLPQEIKQAKLIVMDRKTIISDANEEAETIVRKAEERAKTIISNEEIVKERLTCASVLELCRPAMERLAPEPAALIMSLESVYAALFGWLFLKESMTLWETAGCILVFAAVILSQVPVKKSHD